MSNPLDGRHKETRADWEDALAAEIPETLSISALTVQQHLKAVFEKTGVNSRRAGHPHLRGAIQTAHGGEIPAQ